MTDSITLTGLVATDPRHLVTSEGLAITSFRLASTQRRFDRAKERWVDADTNWYTVTTFRQLAINASTSISKGERVVVTGRLRVRDWQTDERNGTTVDVEADAVGHDLAWGSSTFSRTIVTGPAQADPDQSAPQAPASADGPAAEQSSTTGHPAPDSAPSSTVQAEPEPATPF